MTKNDKINFTQYLIAVVRQIISTIHHLCIFSKNTSVKHSFTHSSKADKTEH